MLLCPSGYRAHFDRLTPIAAQDVLTAAEVSRSRNDGPALRTSMVQSLLDEFVNRAGERGSFVRIGTICGNAADLFMRWKRAE